MRTGLAVGAFGLAQHRANVDDWPGLCLGFTRAAFEAPWAGPTAYCRSVGAKARTAYGAWTVAEHTHKDDRTPPPSVPLFFRGGSHGFGHVMPSEGGGLGWSNDVKSRGHIDLASITEIERVWDMHYVGWSEDLNGVRVYLPPTKPVSPPPSVHGLPQGASGLPVGHLDGPNEGGRATWHDRGPRVDAYRLFHRLGRGIYDQDLVDAMRAWQLRAKASGTKIRTDGFADQVTWDAHVRSVQQRSN